MAAPFERAFDTFAEMSAEAAKYTRESAPEGVREGGEVMAIHYRDEEAIYIKASHDRVTVIFSTIFREETDRIFGKVFLQEFVDARRRAIQNAPQVLFRNEPPLELQDVPGLKGSSKGEVGYVTFGRFVGSGPSQIFWLACSDQPCGNAKDSLLTTLDCSTISTSSHASTAPRKYISYTNVPRLLSLPHQSVQGKRKPNFLSA